MRLLATAASLLLAGILAPRPSLAADLVPVEPWHDWPTIAAAAEPPATETVTLRQIWRLDCGLDAEPMVGEISSAAPGRDGRVLLVDRQLVRVMVISPDGSVERLVGQRGEGPGEVRGVHRAVQFADGRIGVVQGTQAPTIMIGGRGDLVLLDRAGDPAGVWLLTDERGSVPVSMVRELRHAGPRLLVASMRTVVAEGGRYTNLRDLALITPPDGDRDLLARSIFQVDLGSQDPITERQAFEPFALARCDLHASGRVAFAPERDRWLVCVREPDGTGVNLERPWTMPERSSDEREAARREVGDDRSPICDHEPAIGRVRWRPDGRLWVEPGGVEPEPGAMACFDELSPAGELLRRVQVVVPGASAGDRLVIMEDGRFVLLHGFEGEAAEAPAAVLLGT